MNSELSFGSGEEEVRHPPSTSHATWKTVYTGENLSMSECLNLLMALSVVPSRPALRMINHICYDAEPEVRPIKLVMKTVAELGFRQPATLRFIEEVRRDKGLALCPVDTALAMRMHYAELPRDETVKVMSKPITVQGVPCIFAVTRHTRDILLDAVEFLPEDIHFRYERLIYTKPDDPIRAD